MAISLNQQTKKQKFPAYLIIVLLVLLFGAGFAVWFFTKPQNTETTDSFSDVASSWKKFEINFDVLKNPVFGNLNSFEKIGAFQGNIGRENPFKPY